LSYWKCSDRASLAKLPVYFLATLSYEVAEFISHLCTRALSTIKGLMSAIHLAHDLVSHFANMPDLLPIEFASIS